jgi:hypothetical protein
VIIDKRNDMRYLIVLLLLLLGCSKEYPNPYEHCKKYSALVKGEKKIRFYQDQIYHGFYDISVDTNYFDSIGRNIFRDLYNLSLRFHGDSFRIVRNGFVSFFIRKADTIFQYHKSFDSLSVFNFYNKYEIYQNQIVQGMFNSTQRDSFVYDGDKLVKARILTKNLGFPVIDYTELTFSYEDFEFDPEYSYRNPDGKIIHEFEEYELICKNLKQKYNLNRKFLAPKRVEVKRFRGVLLVDEIFYDFAYVRDSFNLVKTMYVDILLPNKELIFDEVTYTYKCN